MSDYISRQEALSELYDVFFDEDLKAAYPDKADIVLDVIRKAPSADVRENVRGEWIKGDPDDVPVFRDMRVCALCGFVTYNEAVKKYNFCPKCGADMRGEKDGK